jgi:hypothetical protein
MAPKKTAVLGSVLLAAGAAFLWVTSTAGAQDLKWYKHHGRAGGKPDWAGPNKVGNGWGFKSVLASSEGVFYAIKENGDLLWYKHTGVEDGKALWAPGTGTKVGSGWGHFKSVIAAPGGILYAVDPGGELKWYKHAGFANGRADWAPGSGNTVGSGWAGFEKIVAAEGGVLYAVDSSGKLLWYKHAGAATGTSAWGPGSGNTVGTGWGGFRLLLAARGGVLYGINRAGDLLWYKHSGAVVGTPSWAPGTGNLVGTGWGGFSAVVAGDHGALYVIDAPAPGDGPLVKAPPAPAPAPDSAAVQLTQIQKDPKAAFVAMVLGRPEAKAQTGQALSAIQAAETKLASVLEKLKGLAQDGNVLGTWKTKSVCVPKQVTVKGSCKQFAVECSKWGLPQCDTRCTKKWGEICVAYSKVNCTSPCAAWRTTSTCLVWWPDSVSTVQACADVRYFDPTEGSIWKSARREAEAKLEAARRAFDQLKAKLEADARKSLETAIAATAQFAKSSWSAVRQAATDLLAKADAGARELFRKVFELAANTAAQLLEPIFARSAGKVARRRAIDRNVAPLAGWERVLRRAAASRCAEKDPLADYNDPMKIVHKAITTAAKTSLQIIRQALGYSGKWKKLLGVAEDQVQQMGQVARGPIANKVNEIANYLGDVTRLKKLAEALHDFKEWVGTKKASAAAWLQARGKAFGEWAEEVARGAGEKLARFVDDLADRAGRLGKWLVAHADEAGKWIAAHAKEAAKWTAARARQAAQALGEAMDDLGKQLARGGAYLRKKVIPVLRKAAIAACRLGSLLACGPAALAEMVEALGSLAAKHLKPRVQAFTAGGKLLGWVKGSLGAGAAWMKKLFASSGGSGGGLLAKLVSGWETVKKTVGPILAKVGAGVAKGASKGAAVLAKIGKAVKKLGVGPLMVALEWLAVGAAYPYANAECNQGEEKIDCGKYSGAEGKRCPDGHRRTAVCSCKQAPASEDSYRACYVKRFNAFAATAVFEAMIGTVTELLDLPFITPLATAVTSAVAAAVALAFSPATAATTGAVIGMATRFAVVVLISIYAEELRPMFDREVWGPMRRDFVDAEAARGAAYYWRNVARATN